MTLASNQSYVVKAAKQFLAWLLITLMLPWSAVNARAFVWCTATDGHSAIEFCSGDVCHQIEYTEESKRGAPDAKTTNAYKHSGNDDCVDFAVLPSAVLSKANAAIGSSALIGGTRIEADNELIRLRLFSTNVRAPLSNWMTTGARTCVDPNILLHRVTVLRV